MRGLFRRGVKTGGGVDIGSLISQLKQAGVPDNQLVPAMKTVLGGSAVAAGGYSIGKDILGDLVANTISAGVGSTLQGAQAPGANPTAGKGFVFTPQDAYQYQRYLNSPQAAIARMFGGKIPSLEEFREQQIESADEQMRGATERQIRARAAEQSGEKALALLQGEIALAGEGLRQQGALGVQQISSLGDVQKQRVQSQYETAGQLLQSAIENIAYVEKLGNSDTRTQLAALPSI